MMMMMEVMRLRVCWVREREWMMMKVSMRVMRWMMMMIQSATMVHHVRRTIRGKRPFVSPMGFGRRRIWIFATVSTRIWFFWATRKTEWKLALASDREMAFWGPPKLPLSVVPTCCPQGSWMQAAPSERVLFARKKTPKALKIPNMAWKCHSEEHLDSRMEILSHSLVYD